MHGKLGNLLRDTASRKSRADQYTHFYRSYRCGYVRRISVSQRCRRQPE